MIYLDNAATSKYKPETVFDAVEKELKNPANSGRGGHIASQRASEKILKTRIFLEDIFGNNCNAVFTKNCTEALNCAILGTVREGEVITTVNEHNSVLRPLAYLERKGLIKIKYVDCKTCETPIIIKNMLNNNTRLVVVNHISNVTGEEQNIEEIGKVVKENSDALFLVDGAQSLGHRKIDIKKCGIDLIAGAGHKGLHSPQGVGFLIISDGVKVKPIIFGGTGTVSDSIFQPEELPESLESGTLNTPAIAGLYEGAKWTYSNFDKINKHINGLADILYNGLNDIKGIKIFSHGNAGIVSFYADCDLGLLSDILSQRYSICVRPGLHCAPLIHKKLQTLKSGLIRASVGYNNSLSDIKSFISATDKILFELTGHNG